LWLSGQLNPTSQWLRRFYADYNGSHGFEHASEQATSVVLTLYADLHLSQTSEALVNG